MNRSGFDQASSAIARLDLTFGPEDVTEDRRLQELRLFRNARPADVAAVVARTVRYLVRRPNPDELRQLLEDERRGRLPGSSVDEATTDEDVVIVWRGDSALAASVRDPVAGVVDVRQSEGLWSCTCRDELACCHVAAVKQTAGAVA